MHSNWCMKAVGPEPRTTAFDGWYGGPLTSHAVCAAGVRGHLHPQVLPVDSWLGAQLTDPPLQSKGRQQREGTCASWSANSPSVPSTKGTAQGRRVPTILAG